MDPETRRSYDDQYEWWSAEGNRRVISVYPTKQNIAMANQWHEYFLWEHIAEKVHPVPVFGKCTAERVKTWNNFAFKCVFFEEPSAPYVGWADGIDQYSATSMYLGENVKYTILYRRDVVSPYLKELGQIQDECENMVFKLYLQSLKLNRASLKLRALFASGKQQKKMIERNMLQLREQIDQKLNRVNEIRAIILGS